MHCSAVEEVAAAVASAADRRSARPAAAVTAHPDAAAARVLVVEDDAAIAELIELYLHTEGLESTCVAAAEEATSTLQRKVFHLVILDINLPGRDGFQFLQHVQRLRKKLHRPGTASLIETVPRSGYRAPAAAVIPIVPRTP